MRTLSKKSRLALTGAVVVAVAGGGIAYGYWSTSGNAAGNAASATGKTELVVTQTAAPGDLAPGVAAGAITGTVRNPANHSMYVHQVTVSIDSVTQADGVAGACTTDDYALSNPVMTVNAELAGGATTSFSGAGLAFNDKATNQDGCKGATVHLAYSAS